MGLERLRCALAERPSRVDAALAAAFCGVSLLQVLLDPIASRPVSVLVAVGSTLPLAWRRRRPALAALAGSAVWLIPTTGFLYLGYVVAVLLFFALGSQVGDLRTVVAVSATAATIGVVVNLLGPEPPGAAFAPPLAVAGPAAAGRLVAHQRAQAVRLQTLADELRREQARATRAAAAEERSRIARELHDIVGHDVSVIALQAEAAAASLDSSPDLARDPIAAIRESATNAMGEIRRVLGVLREDGDVERGPQPGFAQLPALVEAARAAGTSVELTVSGSARAAPASVELAAYRLAQEALTNARKHAPGAPVRLEVVWDEQAVALRVTDTGPGPGPGAGAATGSSGCASASGCSGAS